MSARDQTLDHYHELMQINAVSHLLRAGRRVGLFHFLQDGQKTFEQLCESLSLVPEPTLLLLDALLATRIIEKYGDDYALSSTAQLLCQYDKDLGDEYWLQLTEQLQGKTDRGAFNQPKYFEHIAATQWIHTPSAIQAAEILNIGGEGEPTGLRILDLGCGSAVWSCAMAHRDATASVTAVDIAGPLSAAQTMAESIGIEDRFTGITGEPQSIEGLKPQFDIVLLAQRLFAVGIRERSELLQKASSLVHKGGRLVVIDLFRGPSKPNLAESTEALKLRLQTPEGSMMTIKKAEQLLMDNGFEKIQFSFLAASRLNMGMMVGSKSFNER